MTTGADRHEGHVHGLRKELKIMAVKTETTQLHNCHNHLAPHMWLMARYVCRGGEAAHAGADGRGGQHTAVGGAGERRHDGGHPAARTIKLQECHACG